VRFLNIPDEAQDGKHGSRRLIVELRLDRRSCGVLESGSQALSDLAAFPRWELCEGASQEWKHLNKVFLADASHPLIDQGPRPIVMYEKSPAAG
jgi:hypothetical protein